MSGTVDPATGMIVNLADLDGFVEREVIEAFDHRSLNEEVPVFRKQVPTTENVCMEIFKRLKHFPLANSSACALKRRATTLSSMPGKYLRIAWQSDTGMGKMTKPTEIMLHDSKLELPQESVADLVRKMIALVGEDPNREGLRKTPERFEKALKFLTSGYHRISIPS